MPKMVPTVSTTVIRNGKRKPVSPGEPFDFTKDEVRDINEMFPGALRKPINETGNDDPDPTDATAPEGNASASASQDPATEKAADAAKRKSDSKAATGGKKAPKSTGAAPKVDTSKDEGERDAEQSSDDDGDEGEDEDI